MKKIYSVILAAVFLLASCKEDLNFDAWMIKNTSTNAISFEINGDSKTVPASDTLILDYPENAEITIEKSELAEFSKPAYYISEKTLYLRTIISDVDKTEYTVQNASSSKLSVVYYDAHFEENKTVTVDASSSETFYAYKTEPTLCVYKITQEETESTPEEKELTDYTQTETEDGYLISVN